MAAAKDPQAALLVVLDHADPKGWKPWRSPLSELARHYRKNFDAMSPIDSAVYRTADRFRFEFQWQLPDDNNYTAVVGAIIDGSQDSDDLRERHSKLCWSLRASREKYQERPGLRPLFTRVGYYLFVTEPPKGRPTWRAQLRDDAGLILQNCVTVVSVPIADEVFLHELEVRSTDMVYHAVRARYEG